MKFIAIFSLLMVSLPAAHAEHFLDMDKAEKIQLLDSIPGYRDALLFYTFADQDAILVPGVGNKDESFSITGEVYLSDEATGKEGLAR